VRLTSVLATISGPIVLVGHSYGGAVITNAATGNPNVKALVFIAAFAPRLATRPNDLPAHDRHGPDRRRGSARRVTLRWHQR